MQPATLPGEVVSRTCLELVHKLLEKHETKATPAQSSAAAEGIMAIRMSERTPHVRVRALTRRDAGPQQFSPRESFWRQVQQDSSLNRIADRGPDRLEQMLLREVPGRLSHLLIDSAGAPPENPSPDSQ